MPVAFTFQPFCTRHLPRLRTFIHPRLTSPRRPRPLHVSLPRAATSTCTASSSPTSPSSSSSSSSSPVRTVHYTPSFSGAASDDDGGDTIFALATGPTSAAGVAVMRISGPSAVRTLQSLFQSPSVSVPPPRTASLRTLHDPTTGDILDQALVLFFSAPKSFTAEDVVELHLHGSRAVISSVTTALSRLCRPATRGEFTRRAYENGAIDLLAAEGLSDLLAADTSAQRVQALHAMCGASSSTIVQWRQRVLTGLAYVEAVLDFSDDVGDDAPLATVVKDMSALRNDMVEQLRAGRAAQVVRSGATVALVGPPNAGKSSLLNALAKQDAAIVAPTAGTTRDVVSVRMDFAGVAATVCDTAGLRATPADEVEAEGMRRARGAAAVADVIVCVHDVSESIEELVNNVTNTVHSISTEQHEHEQSSSTNTNTNTSQQTQQPSFNNGDDDDDDVDAPHVMYVFNKKDLCDDAHAAVDSAIARSLESLPSERRAGAADTFRTSLVNGDGVPDVVARIESVLRERLHTGDNHGADSAPVVTRARHRYHVERAVSALSAFLSGQSAEVEALRMPMDLAAEDLRAAAKEVGAITGDIDVEEVLDVIFSEFCIGK